MSFGEYGRRRRDTLDDVEVSAGVTPVTPVCLVVDASWSIQENGRTDELNDALKRWPQRIASRPDLAGVEIAVVVFGPNNRAVPLHLDARDPDAIFVAPDRMTIPTMQPDGTTPLGHALQVGLQLCTARSAELRGQRQRKLPTLAVISDGYPTDAQGDPDHESWTESASQIRAAVEGGQLRAIAVALEGADIEVLESFANPVVSTDHPIEEILEIVTYVSAYGDREALTRDFFSDLQRRRKP